MVLKKLYQSVQISLALTVSVFSTSLLPTTVSATKPNSAPKKVFVCKYVGTPGANERLQTGQNPINVSVNSVKDYTGVGSYFNDAQGRSYVIAEDNGQAEPNANACPGQTPPAAATNPSTPSTTTGNDNSAPKPENKTKTEDKKVFVCKYVGKPHVNERLQTGQNPISVSTHAIEHNGWNGSLPGWFSDAHDRSYVLAYDNGQADPDVNQCPKADVPVTPGQGGGSSPSTPTTPQILSTSTETPSATLPETLPSTGGSVQRGLLIILMSLLAYGIAYLLQGRRKLAQEA